MLDTRARFDSRHTEQYAPCMQQHIACTIWFADNAESLFAILYSYNQNSFEKKVFNETHIIDQQLKLKIKINSAKAEFSGKYATDEK